MTLAPRQRAALLAASLLVVAAAGGACSGRDDLAGRIAAAVAQGDGASVDFSDLTDFEWDRLHIFPPRTRAEEVTAELGFEWPGVHDMGLLEREHVLLFAFVRGGEVVHATPYRRYHGDFTGPFPRGGYTPETAVFGVREEEGGFARWVVRAAVDRSGSGG
jgi:hypothetical protein